MIDMEHMLYEKVMNVMSTWDEKDIYAVSFFVESNGAFWFRDYCNVSGFSISYNTESDCEGAGIHSEERWNYAFWRQNESVIIEPSDNSPEMQMLFDWYAENGIENIGEESSDWENGPAGYKELVDLVANVAFRIQQEGFLKKRFGRPIPIIIHDLEYIGCTLKATEYANPNGEADDFLHGNWKSEIPSLSSCSPVPQQLAAYFRDPIIREELYAASPGLSKEYIDKMLEKLLNK